LEATVPAFIEILKSFGTGLGFIVAALLIVVLVILAIYWLNHLIGGRVNVTFKNIPSWAESAFWLLLFCMFVTMMGYDIRHGS